MKNITNKDIKNGFKWCDFCLKEGVKKIAKYKRYGTKSCEDHKHLIERLERLENENMTEADYQTWNRI